MVEQKRLRLEKVQIEVGTEKCLEMVGRSGGVQAQSTSLLLEQELGLIAQRTPPKDISGTTRLGLKSDGIYVGEEKNRKRAGYGALTLLIGTK